MKDVCINCGVCCKIIPIDWETKTIFRNGLQKYDEEFEDYLIPIDENSLKGCDIKYVSNIKKVYPNLGFFTCKYFKNNRCSNNTKHELCEFPTSPFAILAEDCIFNGEIFIKKDYYLPSKIYREIQNLRFKKLVKIFCDNLLYFLSHTNV